MIAETPENSIELKSLKEWQEALFTHFSTLSKSRKERGLSLFVLEHGLSKLQLDGLFVELRKGLLPDGINRSQWLLWAIYAAEVGYGYDGDEYWQSFASVTPNWNHQFREDIRYAFEEFHKKFSGVKPTGSWAGHFSIIAWPITHAILPRDLLGHFARLLYSTRYKLRKLNLDDAPAIGRLLNANSYNIHSTRFRNFLQQEELVGRIALAMLDEDASQNYERIYAPTLKRIVTDLEKKSGAKEWMAVVRRDVKTKIVGTNTQRTGSEDRTIHTAHKIPFAKPRLTLRRSDQSTWNALIFIPNVSDGLDEPSTLDYLRNTRIKISGTSGKWIPADELLYGLQRALNSWPGQDCVVTFEKQNAGVTKLFEDECKITEGPYWLFRIGRDGEAIEIVSKVVRPGFRYIIVYHEGNTTFNEFFQPCVINCVGARARIFEVPKTITRDDEKFFTSVGLRIQKSIKVFPVGLPARVWDGEGVSEWLTTETPCFCVTHDHPVPRYEISIGNLNAVVQGKPAGLPAFFKIPKMLTGRHILIIRPKVDGENEYDLRGTILLEVREPLSWTPGTTLHNGLTSFLDPPDENVDSFLLGKTSLKIQGPPGRSVKVNFEFYAGNEMVKTIGPKNFVLPVLNKELQGMTTESLKDESLLVARRLKIIIDCDELGKRTHIFYRDIAPLRWYFKSQGSKATLRLIDETDGPEILQVKLLTFDSPLNETILNASEWIQSKNAQDIKGLLIATRGKHEHSIILSQLNNNKSLDSLRIAPKISRSKEYNKLDIIIKSITLSKKWYSARCVNLVAHLQRQKVLETLLHDIFMNLCGNDWAQFEAALASSTDFKGNMLSFSSKIENKSLANVIRFRLENKQAEGVRPDEEKSWFVATADRCHASPDKSLSYFAIKFASNPLQIDEYFDDKFKTNLSKLIQNPVLIRAARFYALGVSKLVDPGKADSFLLPAGWKW